MKAVARKSRAYCLHVFWGDPLNQARSRNRQGRTIIGIALMQIAVALISGGVGGNIAGALLEESSALGLLAAQL